MEVSNMIPQNKGKVLWSGDIGTAGQSVTLTDEYTKYEKIIICFDFYVSHFSCYMGTN